MPRGRSRPAVARGRKCRTCGADKWRKQGNGRGLAFRCLACKATQQRKWKGQNDAPGRLYHAARARAKAAGEPFTITKLDIAAVWPEDGRCPAMGIRLEHGTRSVQDASPTLDRLNGEWGYVPGNIAVISHAANRAKGSLTARQLAGIAAWMRRKGLS